jgi:hypothetical protein
MADLLLQRKHELWHSPAGEAFATFVDRGIHKHYAVNGSEFHKLAQRLNYLEFGTAPALDAVRAAINIVAGEAEFAGKEYPVYSRIAHHERAIYVDVGDDQWQAIRIDATGWTVVPSSDVPVRFRRLASSKPLPLPEREGSLELIRVLFPNIEDSEWVLLQGWLLGCFQRTGGRAHLELQGGQGSGKSTLQRLLVSLIDPTEIPSRSVPRDEQAVMIAVQGKAVLAFDNVSMLVPEMADVWCRLSTGGGIGQRKLHTDQEEVLLKAQLPISWTAITPIAISRPDLQDRTISIHLEQLQDTTYRSEEEIEEAADEARPLLLGTLYDALARALARAGTFDLDRLPRLADFALWVEAAAPALGWEDGAFIDVLEASRASASAMAVDASAVGTLVLQMMKDRPQWSGPASALLKELKILAGDDVRKSRSFPKDPTRLSSQMRRIQRPLSVVGVWVGFNRSKYSRDITLTRNDALYGQEALPLAEPVQEPLLDSSDAKD